MKRILKTSGQYCKFDAFLWMDMKHSQWAAKILKLEYVLLQIYTEIILAKLRKIIHMEWKSLYVRSLYLIAANVTCLSNDCPKHIPNCENLQENYMNSEKSNSTTMYMFWKSSWIRLSTILHSKWNSLSWNQNDISCMRWQTDTERQIAIHEAKVTLITVKTVCNDHLYDKIRYLWFIH